MNGDLQSQAMVFFYQVVQVFLWMNAFATMPWPIQVIIGQKLRSTPGLSHPGKVLHCQVLRGLSRKQNLVLSWQAGRNKSA
ncbi:MAG: hypothetical protein MZU91_13670 [Desulfosudis oleivorans]|nr:hypothetical protein [Desulfosudis oleivorans]